MPVTDPTHPTLNFDSRINGMLNRVKPKKKGLVKLNIGAMAAPFFYANEEVIEGQPLTIDNTDGYLIKPVDGTDGTVVNGLAMQSTFDDNVAGQLNQLAGYEFANDTAQRLDGSPIGFLCGKGFAKTTNYEGVVTPGAQAFLSANGKKLTADNSVPGAALPCYFMGSGNGGDNSVTIRFDFPLV